jgi:hypothetical protein
MPLKINMGGVITGHLCVISAFNAAEFVRAFPPDPNKLNSAWGRVWTFFQNFHASDPYYELIFLT